MDLILKVVTDGNGNLIALNQHDEELAQIALVDDSNKMFVDAMNTLMVEASRVVVLQLDA